jgi:hypothetical protein
VIQDRTSGHQAREAGGEPLQHRIEDAVADEEAQ